VNKRLKEQLQPQNEGLTSLLPDSNVTAIPETPNLAILHWLPVSDHGIEVELGFLLSVGFDLTRYDERFKLDKHGECHGLAFGEYQLYWTNPSKILIYKPSYTTVS
jgi:hypothetical protein